jgi:hypothetical protein
VYVEMQQPRPGARYRSDSYITQLRSMLVDGERYIRPSGEQHWLPELPNVHAYAIDPRNDIPQYRSMERMLRGHDAQRRDLLDTLDALDTYDSFIQYCPQLEVAIACLSNTARVVMHQYACLAYARASASRAMLVEAIDSDSDPFSHVLNIYAEYPSLYFAAIFLSHTECITDTIVYAGEYHAMRIRELLTILDYAWNKVATPSNDTHPRCITLHERITLGESNPAV